MKEDVIVYTKKINGFRNPQLSVYGKIKNDNIKFKCYIDNKEYKGDFNIINYDKEFLYTVDFPNKNKNVSVYIIYNNKEILLCNIKNAIFIKVVSLFSSFFTNIKRIFKTTKKSIDNYGIAFFLYNIKLFIASKVYFLNISHEISTLNIFCKKSYLKWLKENTEETELVDLKYNPKISILIPVYNVERNLLIDCVNSILNQIYTNFEICLVDDCSSSKETVEALKEIEKLDSRIKVLFRKVNGHISETTNDALKMASGEFVGLMDNDDVLCKDALYEMVKLLNKNKKLDFIYSDEDKLDMDGNLCLSLIHI